MQGHFLCNPFVIFTGNLFGCRKREEEFSVIRPKKNVNLEALLMSEGIINSEQLDTALQRQNECGKKIGQVLIDMKLVAPEVITETLSKQFGIPHVWLRPGLIDPSIINLIPKEKARL